VGKVKQLAVQNYRSIKDLVEIRFPPKTPLVLVGENNSGKSNVVRALELLLGETWPGNYELSDHEYHARDKINNIPVLVQVDVEGVIHRGKYEQNVIDNGKDSKYVSRETREQCLCIVVGADRRLAYQLSYSSKYTFMSKLMRRFHDELTADPERVKKLKQEFKNIKNIFKEVEAFDTFTKELNSKVFELSDNLAYSLKTDFSAYDPSNYFHSLRVLPYEADNVLNFEELGTGQEQILAVSFAYAYAKAFHGEPNNNLILVIEEPEAHLHPLAQKWLARNINKLAKEDVQTIITTHSPSFVDLMNLEGIVLLNRIDGATRAKQISAENLATYCVHHGVPNSKINKDNVLGFYAAAATEEILSGLFARKIILVEGLTEALSLPVYLYKLEFDTTKNGIAIIPVHGKGNLAKWWRLFSAYGIPTYVIFDNDSNDDNDARKRKDILHTIGVEESSFEQFLTTSSLEINDKFAVFGLDFETVMNDYFGSEYQRLTNEAQTKYSLSREAKPLVARYVAEKMTYQETNEGWLTLRNLIDKITALSTPEQSILPEAEIDEESPF